MRWSSSTSRSGGYARTCCSRSSLLRCTATQRITTFLFVVGVFWILLNIIGIHTQIAHRSHRHESLAGAQPAESDFTALKALFSARTTHAPHDQTHVHAPKYVQSRGFDYFYNTTSPMSSETIASLDPFEPQHQQPFQSHLQLQHLQQKIQEEQHRKEQETKMKTLSVSQSSTQHTKEEQLRQVELLRQKLRQEELGYTSGGNAEADSEGLFANSPAGKLVLQAYKSITGKSLSADLPYPPANPGVQTFYYAWYSAPPFDSEYSHWNHEILPHWQSSVTARYPRNRYIPPHSLGSDFRPWSAYSSRDPVVIALHMHQMRIARIGTLVLSYWGTNSMDGQGKFRTDEVFPVILDLANQFEIKVALHMEPYDKSTPLSVKTDIEHVIRTYGDHPAFLRLGVPARPVVYLYDSYRFPPSQWAQVFGRHSGSRYSIREGKDDVFAIGLVVSADHLEHVKNSGFDGFYNYFASDGFSYGSTISNWPALSAFAKRNNMLFVPSVGPGYSDLRVRPWNGANVKHRIPPRTKPKLLEPVVLREALAGFDLDARGGQATTIEEKTGSALLTYRADEFKNEVNEIREGWRSTKTSSLYYDAMWAAAARVRAPIISITSFNEWHEGTQIEVAMNAKSASLAPPEPAFVDERGARTSWQPSPYLDYGDFPPDYYLKRTGEWALRLEELGVLPRIPDDLDTLVNDLNKHRDPPR